VLVVPPSEVENDDTAEMDITDDEPERCVPVVREPSPELSDEEEPARTAVREKVAACVVPSDDETPTESPLDGNWLYAPPSKVAQYKAELSRVKSTFVEDDDGEMDEPTMVWEYAEEIFEYMAKLEVCGLGAYVFHMFDTSRCVAGADNAFTQLYRRAVGDILGNAGHAHRLALASPPPLSPSAGDPLDRHQHCRPLPLQACCVPRETPARGCNGHVHCCQVRRNHRTWVCSSASRPFALF